MRPVKFIYFFVAICLGFMIALKATTYLNPDFTNGFLSNKLTFFATYKWPLFIHAFTTPIALLLGIIQFSTKRTKWHKRLGLAYTSIILFLSAPSAFYMAFYAIGGFLSSVSFWILSLLWWYFTFKAYRYAKKKSYALHQKFIMRSFILTNSAIVLRLLSFANIKILHFDAEPYYIVSSWLSWLPFLLAYELYLFFKTKAH